MSASIWMVTVSREFGSGGGDLAARLADRLRWRLVDRDLVHARGGAAPYLFNHPFQHVGALEPLHRLLGGEGSTRSKRSRLS